MARPFGNSGAIPLRQAVSRLAFRSRPEKEFKELQEFKDLQSARSEAGQARLGILFVAAFLLAMEANSPR